MKLSDLPWEPHPHADAFASIAAALRRFDPSLPDLPRLHARALFPNGYTVSVCHGVGFSALPDQGLYTLAVFHERDGRDPPGLPEALRGSEHQGDEADAQALLDLVESLPPRP